MQNGRYTFVPTLASLLLVLVASVAESAYSPDRATSALYFSKTAYCPADNISKWTCASCVSPPAFQVKRVYVNASYGTQAYTGVGADTIVVAFRGSTNIPNWITNMEFTHTAYSHASCVDCTVHDGFFASYVSVRPQLLRDVRELVAAHPRHALLVAGHSLGGAMAVLAAADLAAQPRPAGGAPRMEVYTFGSPRVGNRAFANWFARQLCSGGHESHAVTHDRDMVPHLPPSFMGFVRSPHEVWYSGEGTDHWKACNDTVNSDCANVTVEEDITCSDSVFPSSIADHLTYLGVSILCSSEMESASSAVDVPLSGEMKMVLATDYAFQRVKDQFVSENASSAA